MDPREVRKAQKAKQDLIPDQAARIFKASGNAIQVKTKAEEPGKYNVEF